MHRIAIYLALCSFILAPMAGRAGELQPPGEPGGGSGMYTLEEIYEYLNYGTAASTTGWFMEPDRGPGSTGRSLSEIYESAKSGFEQSTARPEQVLDTVKFFNTDPANWGPQSGTLPTRAMSASSPTVQAGYYAATTLNAVDPDLTSANIRNGKTIFGVSGDADVVDTGSGTATAGDILTAKKAWVDGREITGTIASRGDVLGTEGDKIISIPSGYYSGGQMATARDADLIPGNIRSGKTIFGVSGTADNLDTSSGTAGPGDILNGKIAWVDGQEIIGTIASRGNVTGSEGAKTFTIPSGYYSGTQTATARDSDLVSANIKKGKNIFGVSGSTNVVDTGTGTATGGDILSGEKAWVDGQEVTGTITIRGSVTGSEGAKTITIPSGYYSGTQTATARDSDLVSANIKKGKNIFGVSGSTNVVDTGTGTATGGDILSGEKAWVDGQEITGVRAVAPTPGTGQTASYNSHDDGALKPGETWPSPRFTKNVDLDGDGECSDSGSCNGTVTDNLTGLVWLRNAACEKFYITDSTGFNDRNWQSALTAADSLSSGYCGLSDGSSPGDWHLPTIRELSSLVDFGEDTPAIMSGHPFENLQAWNYWTSTTNKSDIGKGWSVSFIDGSMDHNTKTVDIYVWPVR